MQDPGLPVSSSPLSETETPYAVWDPAPLGQDLPVKARSTNGSLALLKALRSGASHRLTYQIC